jgi:hypothetical protein
LLNSALGVGKPALVVVPLSTLPNWMAELATWAPHLNAVALHGNDAARKAVKKHELYAPLPQGAGRSTKASLQVTVDLHAHRNVMPSRCVMRFLHANFGEQ